MPSVMRATEKAYGFFASRRPHFAGCRTDDELCSNIDRLKRELDELAMAIKIAKQNQYPLINNNKRRFR